MMKFFYGASLLLFAFAGSWAQPGYSISMGQGRLSASIITWSSSAGNYTNKSRHLFLGNNVYVDTSSTGLAGEWKRVDNTADSCSNPFLIASDPNGKARALIAAPLIWENAYTVDKDSGYHVYRLQFRERFINPRTGDVLTTAWTQKGSGVGYADITVADSVLIPTTGVASTKVGAYGIGYGMGTEARACPDDVAATANGATDSVIADTSWAGSR
jgi:hypothetical protein